MERSSTTNSVNHRKYKDDLDDDDEKIESFFAMMKNFKNQMQKLQKQHNNNNKRKRANSGGGWTPVFQLEDFASDIEFNRSDPNNNMICNAKREDNSSKPEVEGISESLPDSKFYKVEAILRPWRIQQVSSALLKMGIRGVTVSDVRGFGSQGGLTERQFGSEFSEDNFVAKVKMEIVVSKDQVDAVIEKIIEEARTGEIGDGKIFVLPVSDVIRVRTGERGEKAERMVGGRADMFSNGLSA